MSGIIASVVANHSMRAPEKWMEPADYMPSLEKREDSRAGTRMTKVKRARVAEGIRAFFGPLAQQAEANG